MQPYVIKAGDYLAALAYRFGFDADTVWQDPANDALRKLRPDPNILWPTDVLYIPDQLGKQPVMQSLVTGQTNSFVSDPPTESLTLRFLDAPLASQAYTIQELPDLTGLVTGSDGSTTVSIPVTLPTFTIVFTDSGTTFEVQVGGLDPIDTVSGIFQRLKNLGYLGADVSLDPYNVDLDTVRDGLRYFGDMQPDAASDPSAGDSPSSNGSAESDQDATTAEVPNESESSDSGATTSPDADPTASSDPNAGSSEADGSTSPEDNAGLDDKGVLAVAISKQLFDAHFS